MDLKRHMWVHEGLKPYKCEFCDAKFSRKNNLKWHRNTHTNKNLLKCKHCSEQFTKPRDLKKHTILHHEPAKVSRINLLR